MTKTALARTSAVTTRGSGVLAADSDSTTFEMILGGTVSSSRLLPAVSSS